MGNAKAAPQIDAVERLGAVFWQPDHPNLLPNSAAGEHLAV